MAAAIVLFALYLIMTAALDIHEAAHLPNVRAADAAIYPWWTRSWSLLTWPRPVGFWFRLQVLTNRRLAKALDECFVGVSTREQHDAACAHAADCFFDESLRK